MTQPGGLVSRVAQPIVGQPKRDDDAAGGIRCSARHAARAAAVWPWHVRRRVPNLKRHFRTRTTTAAHAVGRQRRPIIRAAVHAVPSADAWLAMEPPAVTDTDCRSVRPAITVRLIIKLDEALNHAGRWERRGWQRWW